MSKKNQGVERVFVRWGQTLSHWGGASERQRAENGCSNVSRDARTRLFRLKVYLVQTRRQMLSNPREYKARVPLAGRELLPSALTEEQPLMREPARARSERLARLRWMDEGAREARDAVIASHQPVDAKSLSRGGSREPPANILRRSQLIDSMHQMCACEVSAHAPYVCVFAAAGARRAGRSRLLFGSSLPASARSRLHLRVIRALAGRTISCRPQRRNVNTV